MDLSAGHLLASFVVSTVGFALFRYGKSELRVPQLVTGIGLMVLPVLVSGPLAMLSVGAASVGGLWLLVRAGL